VEDHHLSAVRHCLFNIFAATLNIWRPSPPAVIICLKHLWRYIIIIIIRYWRRSLRQLGFLWDYGNQNRHTGISLNTEVGWPEVELLPGWSPQFSLRCSVTQDLTRTCKRAPAYPTASLHIEFLTVTTTLPQTITRFVTLEVTSNWNHEPQKLLPQLEAVLTLDPSCFTL
jgi:hypothetical protein